jgi:hypothetical protein
MQIKFNVLRAGCAHHHTHWKHQRRGEFADFLHAADRAAQKIRTRRPDEHKLSESPMRLSHKHGIMAPRRPPQLKSGSRPIPKKINHISRERPSFLICVWRQVGFLQIPAHLFGCIIIRR